MRLSISNIAWDVAEDNAMVGLLHKYQVDAIDIAPGKYFADPINASNTDIAKVKNWWGDHNIEIVGMQALLFGTQGLNVFGSEESQQAMLSHLTAVCRIAVGLGATRLVFGSPRNRDCSGLSEQKTIETALSFFQQLADIAQQHGVIICLEPNPTHYGANFMTTTEETARIVKLIQHPSIKMQLDTGAMAINSENVNDLLPCYSDLIGHIHISEADLLPIGDATTNHSAIHHALAQYLPMQVATIEMVATTSEPHLYSIERALQHTITNYRPALQVNNI
ncbi:sugar phosphate isomerase/epimerase [Serratia sp. DD3]|uniref:sugar phosphate isomerase/epimerase family protein n=1 Tax=Serratia sp. DD3 TaxID=1410619 RepID=UPI0004D63CA6|nr:sugar phosphate isomerase/epimerase family protein [Serratia sp. DD3]KEY57807.1 fructoselysine 3-epimerase [Serratia sp. DD3]